jgi:N-dimethylarginine dimethylaminohydrolase
MLAMAQHHAMLPSDGFVYEGDVIIVEGDWVYLTYKEVQEYEEEFARSIESLSRSPSSPPLD